MVKLHDILYRMKARSQKKYLDRMDELAQKLERLCYEADEIPPKLERILCILDSSTPRCLDAGLFALHFADQLKTDLYLLHKGILGPLVLEQAAELLENIALDRQVDTITFDEIKQLVEENDIDLIVTSGGLSLAKRLLTELSVPTLFTRYPVDLPSEH